MTPEQRLEAFRKMVERSPDDAFARYSLAMGLRAAGKADEAAAEFGELARRQPDYVPSYLMWGQVLEALERPSEAAGAYRQGVAAARKAGNDHALSELARALEAVEALKGT